MFSYVGFRNAKVWGKMRRFGAICGGLNKIITRVFMQPRFRSIFVNVFQTFVAMTVHYATGHRCIRVHCTSRLPLEAFRSINISQAEANLVKTWVRRPPSHFLVFACIPLSLSCLSVVYPSILTNPECR